LAQENGNTYEFLPEHIRKQFETLLKETKEIERKKKVESKLFNYKFSSNINLKNLVPSCMLVFDNKLFVFFSSAMHIFQLSDLKINVKVPAPFRQIKSATSLKGFIYVSTLEGIMKINPETLEVSEVRVKQKTISRCLILSHGDHLYAFLNSIYRINPNDGKCEKFSKPRNWMNFKSTWENASSGIVKDNCIYAVVSGNIWQFNLESKEEKKIYSPWTSDTTAMVACDDESNRIYFFQKHLYYLDKEEDYKQAHKLNKDDEYPQYVCATSTKNKIYAVTKNASNKTVFLYEVELNGSRDSKYAEWSQLRKEENDRQIEE